MSASFCCSATLSGRRLRHRHLDLDELAIGEQGWWVQSIVITLITISQALFNHFGIRTTTRLTDFSGYLIFVVAVVLTLTLARLGRRAGIFRGCPPSSTTPASPAAAVVPDGSDGFRRLPDRPALSALHDHRLRRLGPHFGGDPKPAIRCRAGMIHSVFWSLVFGLVMAASFILAIPDRPPGPRTAAMPGSTCSTTCRCRRSCITCSPSASWSPTISARWPA